MLAIIFLPRSFGQLGSYIFYYQLPRPVVKGKKEEVELDMLEVKKGLNFVDPAVWKAVSEHGRNAEVLRDMKRGLPGRGQSLFVYEPDAEVPVGSTSDFTDLMVVEELLRNATDADWISRSITRDPRPEVFRLGSERIKEIQEEQRNRKQNSLTMEVA